MKVILLFVLAVGLISTTLFVTHVSAEFCTPHTCHNFQGDSAPSLQLEYNGAPVTSDFRWEEGTKLTVILTDNDHNKDPQSIDTISLLDSFKPEVTNPHPDEPLDESTSLFHLAAPVYIYRDIDHNNDQGQPRYSIDSWDEVSWIFNGNSFGNLELEDAPNFIYVDYYVEMIHDD